MNRLPPEVHAQLGRMLRLALLLCLGGCFALAQPHLAHHLILLVGATLTYSGTGPLLLYRAQRRWPRVPALLLQISERVVQVTDGRSLMRYFEPQLDYEYEIRGIRYRGQRAASEVEALRVREVDSWGSPVPRAARWWLQMQAGDKLEVAVNPQDPLDAILARPPSRDRLAHHGAKLIAGLMLLLVWLLLSAL